MGNNYNFTEARQQDCQQGGKKKDSSKGAYGSTKPFHEDF